jgi:hypothetical protein
MNYVSRPQIADAKRIDDHLPRAFAECAPQVWAIIYLTNQGFSGRIGSL